MRIILPLFFVFFLIGCKPLWNPTFVPAGYRYHEAEYKAPPGPAARNLGYEYTPEKNAQIISRWEAVADELVGQFQAQSGMEPADIYIHKESHNAFNVSFDHALRQAFMRRGYHLSNMPGATYEVHHEAHPQLDSAFTKPVYNGDLEPRVETPEAHDFLLVLSLIKEGALLGRGAGVYRVPSYGQGQGFDLDFKATQPPREVN